jgi:hypothetical protein
MSSEIRIPDKEEASIAIYVYAVVGSGSKYPNRPVDSIWSFPDMATNRMDQANEIATAQKTGIRWSVVTVQLNVTNQPIN